MDVLNEQALHDKVTDPAITRLNTETIPALQKALNDVLQPALTAVSTDLSNLGASLNADLQARFRDVESLVNSLDGWSLDISIPPITIPPITIRLSKPKEKA